MKTALCFLGLLLTACASDADKLPLGVVAALVIILTADMIISAKENRSTGANSEAADGERI